MQEAQRYRVIQKMTVVSVFINLFLALLKVLVGLVGHSYSLVADGIHSFSDLICDALVLLASRYANVAADWNHPYGHGRIETVATVVLSVFLLALGAGIGLSAIHHLLVGKYQRPDVYTLWVAVVSIAANELLFRYTMRVAKRVDSNLLRANAWHSRADALSSCVVVVGVLGALNGWPKLDAIAAIVVALMIMRMGGAWGMKALKELIDTGVSFEDQTSMRDAVLSVEGVRYVHLLRTRTMAYRTLVDLHIVVTPDISVSEGHSIADQARCALMVAHAEVADVTVHVDVDGEEEQEMPSNHLPTRKEILEQYAVQWQSLLGEQRVLHCHLHYFQQQVSIVIYLPLACYERFAALQDALSKTIEKEPRIKQLVLCLTACQQFY